MGLMGGSPHGLACIGYLPRRELSYFTTSAISRVDYRIAGRFVGSREVCSAGVPQIRAFCWYSRSVVPGVELFEEFEVLGGARGYMCRGVARSWAVVARALLEGVLSCALADGGIASLGGTLPKPLPRKPARHRSVGGTNPLHRLGVRDCDSPRCSRADLGLVDTGLRSFVGCDGGFIPSHAPGCTGLPIRGLCWTSKGAFEGTQRVLAFASCCR